MDDGRELQDTRNSQSADRVSQKLSSFFLGFIFLILLKLEKKAASQFMQEIPVATLAGLGRTER